MTDVVSQIEAVIAGIEARTDHDFGCAGASHICNCGRRVRVRSEIARTLERMVIAAAQTFQSATFGNQMAWQNDENAPQLNAMEVAWGGGVPGYPGTGDTDMSKFRKKPVVIEAHQFGGTVSSADAIIAWAGMEPRPNEQNVDYSVTDNEGTFRDRIERPQQFGPLVIHTLEGDMTAQEGDWIIKGVAGEFYPCKPDIFAATYEPVG